MNKKAVLFTLLAGLMSISQIEARRHPSDIGDFLDHVFGSRFFGPDNFFSTKGFFNGLNEQAIAVTQKEEANQLIISVTGLGKQIKKMDVKVNQEQSLLALDISHETELETRSSKNNHRSVSKRLIAENVSRTIALPEEAELDQITTHLNKEAGELTITVPLRDKKEDEETGWKKLAIAGSRTPEGDTGDSPEGK